MKKIKTLATSMLALASVSVIAGCNGGKDPGGKTEFNGIGPDTFVARERQKMPEAEIVDKNFDYGSEATWAGNTYKQLDLGYVYLQDVIDDNVYDWGHSVMKEGDIYKMWWVRPSSFDAIYYAESKDLKNWSNTQRVIDFSPNATTKYNYTHLKGMLGTPSVLKVNGVYYMFFEAPATEDPDVTQTILEWDNQVLLATSTDGITWEVYSDDKGQPKPIVALPAKQLGKFEYKDYGYGQPNAFYKDGEFYLTYCNVMYDPNLSSTNGIYLAKSSDPFNFGPTSTHTKVSNGNGWGFTFNKKTNKFMGVSGNVLESTTMDFSNAKSYSLFSYIDSTRYQTGFWDFVKEEDGCISTETFYLIHLMGDKSMTSDWRAGHTTWDGYIHAVNPSEYQNREFTLPNGGAATENNLKGYQNRQNTYDKQHATAAYVKEGDIVFDGDMDKAYDKSDLLKIERMQYNWGSNFTTTHGLAKIAYNEKYLYVYARVYDETPNTSWAINGSAQCYQHDGLDIFLDVPNDHGDTKEFAYGIEQYMICTDSNNNNFIIKGSGEADITAEFARPKHRVKTGAWGYDIELQIPWYEMIEDYILDAYETKGLTIGIDLQINDAMTKNCGREAVVMWSDNQGNAFRFTENFGDLYLAPKK